MSAGNPWPWKHLVTDAVYPGVLPGAAISAGFLLWPLLAAESTSRVSLLGRLVERFAVLVEYATTPAGVTYLAVDAALVGVFVVLWVRDGLPGVAWALGRRDA